MCEIYVYTSRHTHKLKPALYVVSRKHAIHLRIHSCLGPYATYNFMKYAAYVAASICCVVYCMCISQAQARMVDRFRTGELNVLIATNIGNEGLDFKQCQVGGVCADVACCMLVTPAVQQHMVIHVLQRSIYLIVTLAHVVNLDLHVGQHSRHGIL